MFSLRDIKNKIREIIRETRSLDLLQSSEIKIENMIRTSEGHYEISGTYEYKSLFGITIETGEFNITLDDKLQPIIVDIKARNHI